MLSLYKVIACQISKTFVKLKLKKKSLAQLYCHARSRAAKMSLTLNSPSENNIMFVIGKTMLSTIIEGNTHI